MNRSWIWLDQKLTLLIYCLLRQAEHSIDHALFDKWSRLRCYYEGQRREKVSELVGQVSALIPDPVKVSRRILRVYVEKRFDSSHFTLSGLRHMLLGPKRSCCFLPDELSLMVSCLEELLIALEHTRPPDDFIVGLRRDLALCQLVIQRRCGPLPGLDKADRVENFNQPDFITHYSINDIVPIPD